MRTLAPAGRATPVRQDFQILAETIEHRHEVNGQINPARGAMLPSIRQSELVLTQDTALSYGFRQGDYGAAQALDQAGKIFLIMVGQTEAVGSKFL